MNAPESKGAEDAARRVSACLTACKSISTKALEAGDLNVLDLQRDRMVLTQQRDTLISAFEEVLRISDRDHEAWRRAHAAIAAVKGPQWRPHLWKTGGPGEGASSFMVPASTFDALPLTGPTIAQLQAEGHLPAEGDIIASISDELGPARSLEDLTKIAKEKGYTMTTAAARKIMDARKAKKAKGGAQ